MAKNLLIWVVIGIVLMTLYNFFQGPADQRGASPMEYSAFLDAVDANKVSDAKIQGNKIYATLSDNKKVSVDAVNDPNLVETLRKSGTKFSAAPQQDNMGGFLGVFLSWFPMLLFIGVWIFFMRQMQGGGGKAMGFGKSKARLLTEKQGKVTFDDVAGIDEAKQELEEIVDFLKDPSKFQKLGGKIPKGVLLVGPPGTGKTLLARAIAGEANVPFFTISGSDFVEMFVGVGASRVRDMFEQGKKNAPCLIFIDEIDAVGRHRGAGLGGGNDEREQTLNQLLVEMDGFEANEGVIIIAATNRPDVLDPALLRPGRFDRQVVVPNPDILGREKILKVHSKKVPLGPDADLKVIARGTPGFSGADLSNLVNEAALLAARKNKKVVSQSDLEEAKDKVMMGAERRSIAMSDKEKELTAYHEAGHAIVSLHEPESDPIHKATIIPRGRALGMVMRLPEGDRYSMAKDRLMADLSVAMGGRLAEQLIFGDAKVTTGASADIKMATDIARRMVTEWGMSEKLGMLAYGEASQEVFLGHSVTQHKHISDETSRHVDIEIRSIVDSAYDRAEKILKDNIGDLHKLAKALLEYETLSGDEIKDLLAGKSLNRKSDDDSKPTVAKKASVPQAGTKKETVGNPTPSPQPS